MHELPILDDLVAAIQKCRKEKILGHAKNLHSQIKELGIDTNDFIGNFLVPMFVDCGDLPDAQKTFDRLSLQTEHSWTSIISGYVECGCVQHALNLYQRMQQDVSASCYTLLVVIKAYSSIGDTEGGRWVHSQAVTKGFDKDVFIGSSLVHLYAKSGMLLDARNVLDMMMLRSSISWTSIISGYAEYGPADAAFMCYEQMQSERLMPDATTFVCVLKACGHLTSVPKGRNIHISIILHGLESDNYIENSLIDMYAKCAALAEAELLSDKLSVRNLVSWTALISGYAEHGPGEKALACFERMKSEGIFPDAVTFASVLKACGSIGAIERGQEIHHAIPQSVLKQFFFVGNAVIDMYIKCGLLAEAQEVFDTLQQRECAPWSALIAAYADSGASQQVVNCVELMEQEGFFVDYGTYVSMLKMCGSSGSLDDARELHTAIVRKGFEANLSVGNALIVLYTKKVAVEEAQQIFKNLPERDVVSWTALIAAYTEGGQEENAIDSFTQMQVEAISPNSISVVCVLKSCTNLGAFRKGQEIHRAVMMKGFENDISVCNALIDMYGASGFLLDSHDVFSRLSVKDVISWNTLIKACGLNHNGEMAVLCFEEMQKQGVEPDDITFTCILFACSRAKLLRKGQEIFSLMRQKYRIIPTIDHYTCVVDLHTKSGCLWEVVDLVNFDTCPSLWMAMLTACKIYGEADLGLRCFQELIRKDPGKAAPYVLMAKTYEAVGMLEEAQKVEELRKEVGAKKKPAIASIEVNKKRHEFVVGDHQTEEVSAMLHIMCSRMKQKGYVPIPNVL